MPERIFKIGSITKTAITALVIMLFIAPYSFGRVGTKLFSIGNNITWNSQANWSLTSNGPVCGLIPQSNDTVVIETIVVQNVYVLFAGNGILNVTNSGTLRGDNLDLSFLGNSKFQCDGEIRTNSISFYENSAFLLQGNGNMIVNNTFTNNSARIHTLAGKLSVKGTFSISAYVRIVGSGILEAVNYDGNGSVFGISSAASIPDGSLITQCNWNGSVNNNWQESSNWSNNIVPESNSNISILASSHNPVIDDKANCNHLFLNSGTELTVNPSAFLEISGNLTVMGDGRLFLRNTITEKSSLILNGNVTGKVQAEYPVIAGQKNLLSSPVTLALSGTFVNMYLRAYDESSAQWDDYIVPTDDPLLTMQGYELFSFSTETRIFEGTIDNSPKTFSITNSGSGLNLTGNPFPGFIDWESKEPNSWQRNSVAAAIYYPDASGSGNYAVYLPGDDDAVSLNNGSRYIAPMQGFFVKAATEGTITVTDKSRVNVLNDSKFALKSNAIKFKLNTTEGQSDEVLLRVIDNATSGFDDKYDAVKIQNNSGAPSIHFQSGDDTKFAINTIPSINSSTICKLNIDCSNSGAFTLSSTGIFNFNYRYPVIMMDKQLNVVVDLRADSSYSFYHSPDMDPARFEIQFTSPDGIASFDELDSEVFVFPGQVLIKGTSKEVYAAKLYTTDGKLMFTTKGSLDEGISLSTANCPVGIYVVQLLNGKQTFTHKILSK